MLIDYNALHPYLLKITEPAENGYVALQSSNSRLTGVDRIVLVAHEPVGFASLQVYVENVQRARLIIGMDDGSTVNMTKDIVVSLLELVVNRSVWMKD